MKRNFRGVNLDEGIPLSTAQDFQLLHLDLYPEETATLVDWIESGKSSLRLGGQIGIGKTTLIKKVLNDENITPDIELHFDRDSVNPRFGDFYAIALAGFIQAAQKLDADISCISLPEELNHEECKDWKQLREVLSPGKRTLKAHRLRKSIISEFENDIDYIDDVLTDLGSAISVALGRPLFILASGVDKFPPNRASFKSLEGLVNKLCEFKTLFEVNALHLFLKEISGAFSKAERLCLSTCTKGQILELFSRRMGIYISSIPENALSDLADLSGGNPRQALRLLVHYLDAKKKRLNVSDCLREAALASSIDFFLYAEKPSEELIQVVKKEGKLLAGTIMQPGDKDTALRALYGNWVLITGLPNKDGWPVLINPLIEDVINPIQAPGSPEQQLLKHYADAQDQSVEGLAIPECWNDGLLQLEHPIELNLTEILDTLTAALLSKDRADRVIIAYRDETLVAPARDYLFAKANTYEYQSCKHYSLTGGEGATPLEQLDEILTHRVDIFSLDFGDKWKKEQLVALDSQRDSLLCYQMIWWIPEQVLNKYLAHWTQLRQLFEIYTLDDELLGSLSPEDIETDIEFFSDLVEEAESAPAGMVKNLQSVLEYLEENRG